MLVNFKVIPWVVHRLVKIIKELEIFCAKVGKGCIIMNVFSLPLKVWQYGDSFNDWLDMTCVFLP